MLQTSDFDCTGHVTCYRDRDGAVHVPPNPAALQGTTVGHRGHVACVRDGRGVVCVSVILGAGIACWLERRTRDRKAASSNPGRSGGGIGFSRVNFVC